MDMVAVELKDTDEKSELPLDNPDGIKYNKDKESIPIGGRSQLIRFKK